MNACRRLRNDLVAFLTDELDERRAERIRTHLKTCPLCCRELALHQDVLRLAEAENPELDEILASVDWTVQAEKIVGEVWRARTFSAPSQRGLPRPVFFFQWKPVLAGCLLGLILGALATLLLFRGSPSPKGKAPEFFASADFLDRADFELARRETLTYLEKSQDLLLEFAQPAEETGEARPSETEVRRARELLSRKKFLNPQLEGVRMAKAKDICDQIELLFYELLELSDGLTDARRQEIRRFIDQKSLLLKIKLLREELQESET